MKDKFRNVHAVVAKVLNETKLPNLSDSHNNYRVMEEDEISDGEVKSDTSKVTRAFTAYFNLPHFLDY